MRITIYIVLFRRKLGGRKTNIHSNLFPPIANTETRTTLHSEPHSLYTTNNSTLIISFSLEHGSSLHKSQRSTDLKPRVSSFYPSSVSGKKPESLIYVILILADNICAVSFQHQFANIHLAGLRCLQAYVQTIHLLLLHQAMSLPHSSLISSSQTVHPEVSLF